MKSSLINDKSQFFIIGPLRTGSSLMSRCLDDHPEIICFCESEINRYLFPEHYIKLHWARLYRHGFKMEYMLGLLEQRKSNDINSLMQWYLDAFAIAKEIYKKPNAKLIGDKSPDYYRSPELVEYLASNCSLIYTVRDPRGILRSIENQNHQSEQEKENRWLALVENFKVWEPYLNRNNVLISRLEDFITRPEITMRRVYAHLDLEYSNRFMEPFQRLYPERFLWKTVIDWESGVRKPFQKERAQIQDSDLSEKMLEKIYSNPSVERFMIKFGYS